MDWKGQASATIGRNKQVYNRLQKVPGPVRQAHT